MRPSVSQTLDHCEHHTSTVVAMHGTTSATVIVIVVPIITKPRSHSITPFNVMYQVHGRNTMSAMNAIIVSNPS